MGRSYSKEGRYVNTHFAVKQKLTQYCKSMVLTKNAKKKKKRWRKRKAGDEAELLCLSNAEKASVASVAPARDGIEVTMIWTLRPREESRLWVTTAPRCLAAHLLPAAEPAVGHHAPPDCTSLLHPAQMWCPRIPCLGILPRPDFFTAGVWSSLIKWNFPFT